MMRMRNGQRRWEMKKRLFIFGLLIAVAFLIFRLKTPRAELVEHHGQTVECEMTAEECLACHDGIVAPDIHICRTRCVKDHPIYVNYPPARKTTGYAPVAMVEAAGIKLVNGQVTCISCHNLKNQDKYHPTVDFRYSKICFACHLK